MKRRKLFRKSNPQKKPPEKEAEEFSVDEILSQFWDEYDGSEAGEALTAGDTAEDRDAREEPAETDLPAVSEEMESPEDREEESLYSVYDILRDYRTMTLTDEAEIPAEEVLTPPAPPIISETVEPALAEETPEDRSEGENSRLEEDYTFHDILNEFMMMPDTGDHAPAPQTEANVSKTADRQTAAAAAEEGVGQGSGAVPASPPVQAPLPISEAASGESPVGGPEGRRAQKKNGVWEAFPDTPPQNEEPFVDTLDYAAIFRMFADPADAERFEEVHPEEQTDVGMETLLNAAAAAASDTHEAEEEMIPLFAEDNPDFRDILREFMMGDQHPIYADMPGIGKKAEEPKAPEPEEEKKPEPEEAPAPRRRREYHVEEDFPLDLSSEGEELSSEKETRTSALKKETNPEDEPPEKESTVDRLRRLVNGLGIRKTEKPEKALNAPKAFTSYEDYLPDEGAALRKEKEEKEAAMRAEAAAHPETPAASGDYTPSHAAGDLTETGADETPEEEIDELLYAGDFPSFGQWILNELMGIWIKLNGVGNRQSTATMQDDREELGPEVNVANASRYYGSQVTMLRMRVQLGLAILAILAYITLGFPVSGMLKTPRVAAGMCLSLQLTVMLLCLDVVTNAAINLTRGRFGADALAVAACLISSFDALAVTLDAFGSPHIPLCLFSSMALLGILFADLLTARALRKSIRVPAIGKRAYCVTAEEGVRGGREITLLKSVRPMTGFVRRAEEAPPDEALFDRAAAIELLAAVVLGLLTGLVKHGMKDYLYILSALLSCSVPVTALLAFAIPFFIGSERIFSSGAAVAGWSGIHDIGCSRNLIVTDRDLFPEDSISIDTVRIFADESAERVIAYAGTMIAASGSGLSPCFADLMERNGCRMRQVEDFRWLSGGGLQGRIEGHTVLCGSSDLMQLMNVKVPYRLVDQTTVLLAIDGVLFGIFKINYTAQPEIRTALQELIASNRHPIFAIRDFNITPEMLHSVFDVATDGYDFPPYGDRFRISEAKPSETSQVSGVVCREGLGPLTRLADTGRSMYVAIRMNLIITALTAILGTLLVLIRLIGPGILSAWLPFVLMVLDAIFVTMISLFMRF